MNASRRGGGRAPSESELRACVRRMLHQYFDDHDGDDPHAVFGMVLSEIEVPMLQVVLERTGGNQTRAARVLGINRGTLRKKLAQYGLD